MKKSRLHAPLFAGEVGDGDAPQAHLGEGFGIEFPVLAGVKTLRDCLKTFFHHR